MNFTEQEQEYYELIIDMLDNDIIEESERALLNKRKSKYGISDKRAEEIENFALQEMQNKKKPKFNTKGEEEYYELLKDMLEDVIIDESGRNLLNKRKIKYGVSDERAKEFEEYIKSVNGICNYNNDLLEQGKLYYNNYYYEEAIEYFNKAVGLEPNDANNWRWLGRAYNADRNYEEAIRCLKKVVEIEPNNVNNWKGLGDIYNNNDNYEEAIKCFKKVEELNPRDVDNLGLLGRICNANRNYEEAILYLKKATELDPRDERHFLFLADSYNKLGDSYNEIGKFEEAKNAYIIALEIKPNDAYAKEKLKNITSSSGIFNGIGKFFK